MGLEKKMNDINNGISNNEIKKEQVSNKNQIFVDKTESYKEDIKNLKKEIENMTLVNKDLWELTVGTPSNFEVDDLEKYAFAQFRGQAKVSKKKEIVQQESDVDDSNRSIYEALIRMNTMENHFNGTLRALFGGSLKSLIPYQLNENALSKYGVLFDGYYRNVCGDSMIPRDVIKLISFYYPLFKAFDKDFSKIH